MNPMKYFIASLIFLTQFCVFSQFADDFSDNNFTSNPVWSGDDSVFIIIDDLGNERLRSNKTIASTSFYLSTPSTQAVDGQWEFYSYLNFSTSSANFVDIYLTSDQSNLLSGTISGYFVRIGGTADEICLFKKVAGVATKIIDGVDGVTNSSNNYLKIKVTCSATNEWKLERDLTGTGNSYFTEGIITDASVLSSSFFGVYVTQSTSTFFQKHYFDDFYVGPIIFDVTPPVLLSATAINANQIDVLFNEPLDQASAEDENNYDIQPFQSAALATLDLVNPALVHITPAFPLGNGSSYNLFTSSISDVSMNISGNQSTSFSYVVAETPAPGDVIINEFLCDETPSVGLPLVEYVEIFNRSSKYFDLQGWKLGDNSSEGTITQAWLYPGEYIILCSTTKVDSFAVAVGVTSFPSLNNTGDDIVLKSNTGVILNKTAYTDAWYQDPSKDDGGYSIELINPNDPCSDASNWRASNAINGGTPGQINSVNDVTPDTQAPQITLLLALAPNYLEVYFNEGMDSTLLADAIISTSPSLTIQNNYVLGAYPSMITLEFAENLVGSQNYSLLLENVGDCWLNTVDLSGNFALPENAVVGDVVINEILFDPYTGGYDWIEVYNNSSKLINLNGWQLANYDDDTISNHKTITSNFLLKAGGYAVIGKDSSFVKQNYPAAIPGTFVYSETPSFNNDSSTVYLIYNSQIHDKVSYTDNWHFKLLDNTDGVSLERIDPNGVSNDFNNWHSAAEAIGFATPGGKNSQYYPALTGGDFTFTSQVISPDNDGYEDLLQISYEMNEPGLLGNFTIYDDRGRLIRKLIISELLATKGSFVWDGINDDGVKASIGTYVAVFEAFSINGGLIYTNTKAFVVAGKI